MAVQHLEFNLANEEALYPEGAALVSANQAQDWNPLEPGIIKINFDTYH